jgi:hypothetical protein
MYRKAIFRAVMHIRAIDELIDTGIFTDSFDRARLRKSALTELMVCLGELVKLCAVAGRPVDFADDVIVTPEVANAGDLIGFVRDELCHCGPGEENRSVFRYAAVRGRALPIPTGGGTLIGGCDYDDDVAYCFADQRIYWKRHILRALDHAKATLAPPGSEAAEHILMT